MDSIRSEAEQVCDAVLNDIIFCAKQLLHAVLQCQQGQCPQNCAHTSGQWLPCDTNKIRVRSGGSAAQEEFLPRDDGGVDSANKAHGCVGPPPNASMRTYAGTVFKQIRALLKIEMQSFSQALRGKSFADFRVSEGASGALLVFSDCGEYIVKTIEEREKDVIERKAASYLNHLRDNPDSYLKHTAYLGLFAVRVYGSPVYFVVMRQLVRLAITNMP